MFSINYLELKVSMDNFFKANQILPLNKRSKIALMSLISNFSIPVRVGVEKKFFFSSYESEKS